MVSFRDIVTGLRQLDLDRQKPVIAHASLSAFGDVRGGADTLLGALLMTVDSLLMPTFTYKTMVIPETGPAENALQYGSGKDTNRLAEIFKYDMPADRMMGVAAEALRHRPGAKRSNHPILSFTGVNTELILQAQKMQDPLGLFRALEEQDGWVLLLGVDHTVNTAIHYAESLAERKQFVRWALTREGVKECPGFPGCSDGFEQAAPVLEGITRQVQIGNARVRAVRLQPMIECLVNWVRRDPLALLCERAECERCDTIRQIDKAQKDWGMAVL